MDSWTVGLVVVIVVGLAVILYGALADRARNRRAAEQILAPPQRTIPQFRPDSPAPHYLSDLQARRPSTDPERDALSTADREQLEAELRDPATVTVAAGFLSRDFITDKASGRAVLEAPRILVCSDRVESTRELLGVLEKLILSRTPLVVVAPALSDEVKGTLEVNQIRGTMRLLAVLVPDAGERQAIADATLAQVRDRSDLQSGFVWVEHLGSCRRWVSMAKNSFVIGVPQPRASGA